MSLSGKARTDRREPGVKYVRILFKLDISRVDAELNCCRTPRFFLRPATHPEVLSTRAWLRDYYTISWNPVAPPQLSRDTPRLYVLEPLPPNVLKLAWGNP